MDAETEGLFARLGEMAKEIERLRESYRRVQSQYTSALSSLNHLTKDGLQDAIDVEGFALLALTASKIVVASARLTEKQALIRSAEDAVAASYKTYLTATEAAGRRAHEVGQRRE